MKFLTPCIHTSVHTIICPPLGTNWKFVAHMGGNWCTCEEIIQGILFFIVKGCFTDTDVGPCQCLCTLLSSQHYWGSFANAEGGLLTWIIMLLVQNLLKKHLCLPGGCVCVCVCVNVIRKKSTKPLLRRGWCRKVVQWSTNSWTFENRMKCTVQLGPSLILSNPKTKQDSKVWMLVKLIRWAKLCQVKRLFLKRAYKIKKRYQV